MRIAECGLRNEKNDNRKGAKYAKKGKLFVSLFSLPSRSWRPHGSFLFFPSFVLSILICSSASFADESLSASGRLDLHGVQALESDSVKEDPSFEGRLKLDDGSDSLRFHSWLEGGWDGAVQRPPRDHSLFKNYDQVYQSNTPYLEFKEAFVGYSVSNLDLRAGVQRFAWGRLDEYPPNDLLNPWDYTRFLRKPLEDRKIGVPSVAATLNENDWSFEGVWVPVMVPYRLPLPTERWAGSSLAARVANALPNAQINPDEPDLPDRTVDNSNIGLRIKKTGDIEWALNFFHGFDPRPVFKTTALAIIPQPGMIAIDPGYVPDFHRMTAIGTDAAAVRDNLSLRAELVYSFNRYLNIDRNFWGYPAVLVPGVTPLNPSIEQKHDTVEYGVGADYRLFEDGLLTVQAQQTITLGNIDLLYQRRAETLLWANVKIGFMNQKIETNFNIAYNPEHGDYMPRVNGWYIFTDSWKAGATYVAFAGPDQSLFGSYSRNDQIEADVVYSW